jgi:DNA-binding IclR family transcriptional regulator
VKLSSLDKSLQLIDILCQHPRGLSLQDLSRHLGLPKSSVHHILATFLPHQYVFQDPETKKYTLGFKFLSVAKVITDNLDLRRVARPHLQRLGAACGEAVHLAVLRGGRVVYIDKIDNVGGGLSLATYVGFATDPHAAAGGKVLLSELERDRVAALFQGQRLKRYARNTITSLEELFGQLELVKSQGFSLDDEEYYEGVRCVAAPIRLHGRIVAALSITGSIFTMTTERIERELIGLAVQTGRDISAALDE